MRRVFALLFAVGLLAAMPATASAGGPPPEGAIARVTSVHLVVGRLPVDAEHGPSRSAQMLATTTTVRCWYAYWIATAYNITDTVLFQYKEQVEWCSNGTKVVSDDRWTVPITPRPWLWQYSQETLYNPSYSYLSTAVTYRARGEFNQVIPTFFGWFTVSQSHPLVSITARANGTASGSISW